MMWLGIDIGHKRSGVAVSDSGVLSRPLVVLTGTLEEQVVQFSQLYQQYPAEEIVLGQPARGGDEHPAKLFAKLLEDHFGQLTNAPRLIVVDETLTTKEAERQTAPGKTTDTDLRAAQLILEQYFTEQESHAE